MTTPKRPRRQKKDDRLLSPDAHAAQVACDLATAPFDRAAGQMDDTWGIDRLPELVTPQTAARYGAALGALNEAIRADDPQATAQNAANCVKGLASLDAEARRLGHEPTPPTVWEIEIDGTVYGLIQDTRDWQRAERPGLEIVTMREAMLAFSAYARLGPVEKCKALFPGAEITGVKEKLKRKAELELELDDEIQF